MRVLITTLLLMVAFGAMAQRGQRTGKPIKEDNLLVDLTYESLGNQPAGVHFDFGFGASFQLLYDHQFKVKTLSGAIGIGYSNANYYNNAMLLHKDSVLGDYAQFIPMPEDSSYKRNKYVTNYFDIPVEIRYRSKPNSSGHSWKAAVGFKVGFRLGSHTHVVTDEGVYKDFIHPNLTRTRYGLSARVGYGRVGLSGYYSLSTLFEEGKGQRLVPWNVGITISPF
ncbi:PorT family protein [bacterium SCSIO 12741]|nr:PorT family protein [bacterium SCSIO 12741]